MFGIGGFELFLILIFGFLIFGPDKLPAIAKTVGKAIAKFRGAQEEMSEQLKSATFIDKDSDEPFKNPLDIMESAMSEAKSKASDARKQADAVTEKVASASDAAAVSVQERAESFAERKARYDREREKRRAEAADEAKAAAAKADAEREERVSARENPTVDVPAKTIIEEEG